uniref:Uncharacterized protein n=1 Tax=Anguilla anguilla TaxID=7936 RepID=A0A0E9XH39_ANGAN
MNVLRYLTVQEHKGSFLGWKSVFQGIILKRVKCSEKA